MQEFERCIAMEVKRNLKAFFRHANSKLKTKVEISDLEKDSGNTTTSDEEKAEVFNKFITSVFTKEDTTNIPYFDQRQVQEYLEIFHIKEDNRKKKLSNLNAS